MPPRVRQLRSCLPIPSEAKADVTFVELGTKSRWRKAGQFPEGSSDIIPRHFFAPGHGKIGIGERLRGLVCGRRGLVDRFFRQFLSGNRLLRGCRLDGVGANAAQDDFGVLHRPIRIGNSSEEGPVFGQRAMLQCSSVMSNCRSSQAGARRI